MSSENIKEEVLNVLIDMKNGVGMMIGKINVDIDSHIEIEVTEYNEENNLYKIVKNNPIAQNVRELDECVTELLNALEHGNTDVLNYLYSELSNLKMLEIKLESIDISTCQSNDVGCIHAYLKEILDNIKRS